MGGVAGARFFNDIAGRVAKVGRNAPCPCGSGLKFKRCCLSKPKGSPPAVRSIPPEVLAEFRKREEKEAARQRKFGDVRPVIHLNHMGQKIVAVGNRIYYSPQWRTFHDFLFDYIKQVLGAEWGQGELSKPIEARHQILKWYDALCRFQKNQTPDADGMYRAVPNGAAVAYLLLAYDLYILADHLHLQDRLVARLKHPDQFQGARYELFVAATCIRAGYRIEYADETDSTTQHPEFVGGPQENLRNHQGRGQEPPPRGNPRTANGGWTRGIQARDYAPSEESGDKELAASCGRLRRSQRSTVLGEHVRST